jgi:hypothetical protein
MGKISGFVGSVVGGRTEVTETETRRYDRPAALAVETRNGTVTVTGEDRDDVECDVTWRAADRAAIERARLAETGGGEDALSLRVQTADGDDVTAALDLRVPADLDVDRVQTANGRVDLRGTAGDCTVETTNGSVAVTDHAGDCTVETTNGSVTLQAVSGYVDLASTNGSIEARTIGGLDGARTVNGRIDAAVPALRGDATVETRTGSVVLRVAPDLDAALSCTTNLGSIDAPVVPAAGPGLGSVSASGTLGTGEHALAVESAVGSIEVRAADRRDALAP